MISNSAREGKAFIAVSVAASLEHCKENISTALSASDKAKFSQNYICAHGPSCALFSVKILNKFHYLSICTTRHSTVKEVTSKTVLAARLDCCKKQCNFFVF